ncbi:hypothetical protein [Sphingomicrobium marinum]|uniref:hypothetical protein n=1 Tax=Sphingomicrobium marinum TaxID=1227950 RepID=UPI002240733E|nr:hypothetical protein [Sphingomicrobium marinum]
MTEFAFVFSLYSLLLSFSLVALLSGLGKSLDAALREDGPRVGWLVPLLGLFVLLDLLSFWAAAWTVRDLIAISGPTLTGVLLFASGYYLAAHLVFPDDPSKESDLADHFYRVRKPVLGILVVLLFVQWGYYVSVPTIREAVLTPMAYGQTLVLVALMLAAMWVKKPRWITLILAALCLRYLVVYLFL